MGALNSSINNHLRRDGRNHRILHHIVILCRNANTAGVDASGVISLPRSLIERRVFGTKRIVDKVRIIVGDFSLKFFNRHLVVLSVDNLNIDDV